MAFKFLKKSIEKLRVEQRRRIFFALFTASLTFVSFQNCSQEFDAGVTTMESSSLSVDEPAPSVVPPDITPPAPAEPQPPFGQFKAMAGSRGHHTCVLTINDTVKCWGDNRFGQLGNNTLINSSVPVDVVGLTGIKAIASGYTWSCAITSNDTVKCWGNKDFIEIGAGSTVPVDIVGLTDIKTIAVGMGNACAITFLGAVKCWGFNRAGALGDGTTTDSAVAVNVVGLTSGVKEVVVNGDFACAIVQAGTVKCWGLNSQLMGLISNSLTPVDVPGLVDIKTLAVGTFHICAITRVGAAKCWGINTSNQLGDGLVVNSSVPVTAVGLAEVKGFAAAYLGNCFIAKDETVKCWGGGGVLGDGTMTNSAVPVNVVGLAGVVRLTSGFNSYCALTKLGAVKCWGNNTRNELGSNVTETRSAVPVDVAF